MRRLSSQQTHQRLQVRGIHFSTFFPASMCVREVFWFLDVGWAFLENKVHKIFLNLHGWNQSCLFDWKPSKGRILGVLSFGIYLTSSAGVGSSIPYIIWEQSNIPVQAHTS